MKKGFDAGVFVLVGYIFLVGVLSDPGGAQSKQSKNDTEGSSGEAAQPAAEKSADSSQELILEPLADTQTPSNTDGSYKSVPVGKRQKWQLDRGHFTSDEKMTGVESPDDLSDDYSGIRLRLPKRK